MSQEVSVSELIKELHRLKKQKLKLDEIVAKLELKEEAILDSLMKFYTAPLTDDFEVIFFVKRPLE